MIIMINELNKRVVVVAVVGWVTCGIHCEARR